MKKTTQTISTSINEIYLILVVHWMICFSKSTLSQLYFLSLPNQAKSQIWKLQAKLRLKGIILLYIWNLPNSSCCLSDLRKGFPTRMIDLLPVYVHGCEGNNGCWSEVGARMEDNGHQTVWGWHDFYTNAINALHPTLLLDEDSLQELVFLVVRVVNLMFS